MLLRKPSPSASRPQRMQISISLWQGRKKDSVQQISIPQDAVKLLIWEHAKHPDNSWLFPSSRTGDLYHLGSSDALHQRILTDAGHGTPLVP